MAKISSDLLHVLNNIIYGKNITLKTPIRFHVNPQLNTGISEIDKPLQSQIVAVYKKGSSWKMSDEFNNEWTISNLDDNWQFALYSNILSMYDNRVSPVNYDLTL